MQGILASSSPGESKLRRRRRWLVYLLRAVWFGVAVLVVELMLLAIRPAYARWVTPCTGPPCASDLRLRPADACRSRRADWVGLDAPPIRPL